MRLDQLMAAGHGGASRYSSSSGSTAEACDRVAENGDIENAAGAGVLRVLQQTVTREM